jgi:hypothetical protein
MVKPFRVGIKTVAAATVIVLVLLGSLIATEAATIRGRIATQKGWKRVETDVITVLFPSGGSKPIFLWWYNKEPSNVYVVKYQGLIEYFTFKMPYYNHLFDALPERLEHVFEKLKEVKENYRWRDFQRLRELEKIIEKIGKNWGHSPYLPFSGCQWSLENVGNITTVDGKVIGLTFTFNLIRAPPMFDFAENNISIRVRFYYEPVNEAIDTYKYTVQANEMKMDFIVDGWEWNLKLVAPLLKTLRDYGVNIPETNSGLALNIHISLLNQSRLQPVLDNPEEAEAASSMRAFIIENIPVKLGAVSEDETPLKIEKKARECFKLKFADEDKTLAGFFKFVASAIVVKKNGETQQIPVTASYRASGSSVNLFISYPYFEGKLIHDPSIGVETQEAAAQITPKYEVAVSSEATALPVAKFISFPVVSMPLMLALVVLASSITLAVILARLKGRTVVLRFF